MEVRGNHGVYLRTLRAALPPGGARAQHAGRGDEEVTEGAFEREREGRKTEKKGEKKFCI